MNKSLYKVVMWAVLSGTVATSFVACAPTDTRRGAGEVVDDSTLTARAKSALIGEPGVKSMAIEVETYRGVIQLSGFVDSQEMAQRAVTAVSRVPGNRGVKNDMRIKPGQG